MKGASVALALMTVACGPVPIDDYVSPAKVVSTDPASIRLTASSRPDQRLDVAAEVMTVAGVPVPNVVVTFAVTSGTLTIATIMTGTDGYARTIASAAWQNTISAEAGTLRTSFTILGVAPVALPPTTPTTPSPTPPVDAVPVAPSAPTAPAPLPLTVSVLANSTTYQNQETLFGVNMPVSGFTPRVVLWSFGDGTTSAINNFSPRHTYSNTGSFTVTLDVADDLGRTASATKTVTVIAAPVATPAVPLSIWVTITCSAVTPVRRTCTAVPTYAGTAIADSLISPPMNLFWGDGTSQVVTTGVAASHDYALGSTGTRTIRVQGTLKTGEAFESEITIILG